MDITALLTLLMRGNGMQKLSPPDQVVHLRGVRPPAEELLRLLYRTPNEEHPTPRPPMLGGSGPFGNALDRGFGRTP